MTAVGLILCALFLLDALRLRLRWRNVIVLSPDADASASDAGALGGVDVSGTVASTPDGEPLDPLLHAAAARAMKREGVEVLDLLPGLWRAPAALAFLQLTDPKRTRDDRLSPGRTAGRALIATRDVEARARSAPTAADGTGAIPELAFQRHAAELRRCAATMAHAVAPKLISRGVSADTRAALFRELMGPASNLALGVPLVVYGLLTLCLVTSFWAGLLALLAFHAQPAIALVRTPAHCPDLIFYSLLRAPIDFGGWLTLVFGGRAARRLRRDAVRALRPVYADLMAQGEAAWFERRAERCPLCESQSLAVFLVSPDRVQHKPGRFTLERCGHCGHIFQNPRLSLEGLSFYYRDFYDGLGEAGTEAIFGFSSAPYLSRALLVAQHAEPSTWLDVGAGHGHFCLCARQLLPETRFDGLDLSDGVDIAVRRKWMDRGIRGLFPERAESLRGQYDVVSMSHYLEHTREPRAELDAAHVALRAGGHLLIELPDPTSRMGRILKTYWMPWFQPQHQHFLDLERLAGLLSRAGFDVVQVQHKEPHHRVDFVMAAYLWLGRVAPRTDLPWRAPSSLFARVGHTLVVTFGWPLLLGAWALDRATASFFARPGWSNAFRVLARRREG